LRPLFLGSEPWTRRGRDRSWTFRRPASSRRGESSPWCSSHSWSAVSPIYASGRTPTRSPCPKARRPANIDENKYARFQDSNVETLLIGGELDFATPPQWATRELLPQLPNGREVVLDRIGHSDDFWTYQPGAGSRLINTFFDSGRVDRSLYRRTSVDFTPAFSHGAVAKIVLGVMLGFAALAVLGLLWMALRVRRRGAFGREASATLRFLYPIVLGLGGWFLGVLIVITTLPSVPLNDELLAALSIGGPIGLSIYFAWVNRDWSARTKFTGFAAGLVGALIGARLGFNLTEGLFAVITTIVGATAGGNFALIALDIAWDWLARDRSAARDANETLEARPSSVA
jgi:TAP-like protein